jgi:predicted acylesterase/phospholipase RssA
VATNWATGEVKVFKNEDLTDEVGYQAILASAAIPGFFPPQYIEKHPYVDGGVVMNTPLNCAIQAGGNFLHVIYLDPDISQIPLKVLQNTYNTLDRTILLHNATIINEDIDHAALINEGLDVIDSVSKGEPITDDDMRNFIQVAASIQERIKQGAPYRKLILHRYHPHEDPGGGGIGILNFDRDRLLRLIEQGFNETVDHNCFESNCILIG